MSARENCPELFQFFGGYLHQDWPEEYGTVDAALACAIKDTSPDGLKAAADQLRSHRPDRGDEAATDAFLRDLRCEYDPSFDGLTNSAWLDHVQALLDTATR